MIIMLCDDVKPALVILEQEIHKVIKECEIVSFNFPTDAYEYAEHLPENESIDIAFLDIEMVEMNGIELAKRLKHIMPDVIIIFVSGYSEYAMDAYNVMARGYLLKPASSEKIKKVLDDLKIGYQAGKEKKLVIKTFGNFDVFVEGRPLIFTVAKSKELLAYMIDRKGASLTSRDIAAMLWPEKPYAMTMRSNVSRVILALKATLNDADVNIEEIIIRKRNFVSIDTSKVDCDYYRFLEGDLSAINAYRGEYMSNYDWAELTLGRLEMGIK